MPRRKADAICMVTVVRKGSVVMDGDVEGHEFRGNQYIGGGSYKNMSPEQKVKAILKAKKILQPASKGKFSESEVKAAQSLLAHTGAAKGKGAEKIAGVAKQKDPGKVIQTKETIQKAVAALVKEYDDGKLAAQAYKYTVPGLHHSDEHHWEQKIAGNVKAVKAGKDLPNPMTAKHLNWVAEQKGDPKPFPGLPSKPAPEFHKYTGTAQPTGTTYIDSEKTPTKSGSSVPTTHLLPPSQKEFTVAQQMEHTHRDKPLTTEQYHAIQSYTGSGYHQINGHLRSGDPVSDQVKEHIKNLDEAFKGASLKEDRTVWRGVNREVAKQLFGDELRTGMTIMDKGIISTSTSQSFAANWKGTQGILLEIKAPKGIPALDVHKMSVSGKHEAEILLPRNTQFRVESVELPSFSGDKPIKVRLTHVAA